jgi:hypothetical protein
MPGMSVMLYCARKLNFFSCVVDSYISSKGKIQTRRERERERDAANWMMDLYYIQVEFSNIQVGES